MINDPNTLLSGPLPPGSLGSGFDKIHIKATFGVKFLAENFRPFIKYQNSPPTQRHLLSKPTIKEREYYFGRILGLSKIFSLKFLA